MADLPSGFWGGWVTAITLTTLAGLAWLLFSIYFSKSDDDAGHDQIRWDETLQEGSRPAPMWWFWLILSAMVITVVYLMLYPGLGTFKGMLKWSQKGRLEESYAAYQAEYAPARDTLLNTSFTDLQADTRAMTTAAGIYNRNCATCHGAEADGQANMFPNLRDADWQWGGTTAQIEQTLVNGRTGRMPPWRASFNDEQIAQLVTYVGDMDGTSDAAMAGKALYGQFCFSCHGIDGSGNVALGAPNLKDDIWLYGGDEASLTYTLVHGRTGMMPAFKDRLEPVQIRLLVAWLTR